MSGSETYFISSDPLKGIAAVLLIVFCIFIYVFRGQVVSYWVYFVSIQLWCMQYLDLRGSVRESSAIALTYLNSMDTTQLSFEKVRVINDHILRYSTVNFVLAILLLWLAFKVWTKERFEGALSLESLIRSQRGIWPHLEFLSRVDPTKYSQTSGIFAERRHPLEYAVQYSLISKLNSKLKSDRAIRFNILRKQLGIELGERFTSVENLPVVRRAMVAVALLNINEKPDRDQFKPELLRILRFLNRVYSRVDWIGKPKMERSLEAHVLHTINPILAKYANDLRLAKATEFHDFELTVLMRLFDHSTKFGKLTPSWYPFLMPWDRSLYFALHELDYHESPNLNRKTIRREPKRGVSVEAFAAKPHYFSELAAGMSLTDPSVTEGINSFVDYFVEANVISTPDGYEESSGSAATILENVWMKHNAETAYKNWNADSDGSIKNATDRKFPGFDDGIEGGNTEWN